MGVLNRLIGAARISGTGVLIYSVGTVKSVLRVDTGQFKITLNTDAIANEHVYHVQPITNLHIGISATVFVIDTKNVLIRTTIENVAADVDFYFDISRVRVSDGSVSPIISPVPSIPPPHSTNNYAGTFSGVSEPTQAQLPVGSWGFWQDTDKNMLFMVSRTADLSLKRVELT